jgi:MrfA Zn-binding domain
VRRGYLVEPHFKVPARATKGVLSGDGVDVGIIFGHEGRLLLINDGMRASDEQGFRFCTRCRLWNPPDDHFGSDKPCGEAEDSLVHKVVIFNEGLHDILLLDVDGSSDRALTLMHALRTGVQVAFGLDQSEVGGFIFAQPDGRHLVLLYDTDEGGIGVLEQLGRGKGWARLIERTLEILHFDPVSGDEQPDACVRACYDCLMTFYNQLDHDRLDRSLVRDLLLGLRAPAYEFSGDESRWEDLVNDAVGSLEPEVLSRIRKLGLPAPSELHKTIHVNGDPIAEADLFYEPKTVVFIDGPAHDKNYVDAADETKRRKLKARGYQVVVIHHSAVDDGVKELAERLNIPLS